jgi:hypothetical protein
VILQHIPRENNGEANRLAQSVSGYRENQEVFAIDVYSFGSDLAEDDWRKEIAVIWRIHPEKSLGSSGIKL